MSRARGRTAPLQLFKKTTEPLPQRLNRNKIYILPTRAGLMFIAGLFTMLLISINHENNLGFLLTFLLSSVLVVSMIYTHKNIEGLILHSTRAKPVFAGEIAHFDWVISSPQFDRTQLQLQYEQNEPLIVDLERDKQTIVQIPFFTVQRGQVDPGTLTVTTLYPFSFFYSWSRVAIKHSCTVYPKPIKSTLPPSLIGTEEDGEETASTATGTDDFDGLRGYTPGDSPKHIYWKGLARGQGTFTKVFSAVQGGAVLINLDDLGSEELETRLSKLADQVLQASAKKIPFALKLNDFEIPLGEGEVHKHRCLNALASYGGSQT